MGGSRCGGVWCTGSRSDVAAVAAVHVDVGGDVAAVAAVHVDVGGDVAAVRVDVGGDVAGYGCRWGGIAG